MKIDKGRIKALFKKSFLQFLGFGLKPKARYSKNDYLGLLTTMSLTNSFAEWTSNSMKTPNADTLLGYLKTLGKDEIQKLFDTQTSKAINILKSQGELNKPIPIAIDWHDIMYYGNRDDEMVVGTQHKNGSNYAFQYMTAVALVSGKRIILGILPIGQRKNKYELVKTLLLKILSCSARIRYVTMDKGFFDSRLIEFLDSREIRYIIHMPRTKQAIRKKLWIGRKLEYTTNSHKRSKQISFDAVVACDYEKRQKYLFATNLKYSANTILCLFRRRWGIETSYRVSNQFLAKTTSRNYSIRFFLYSFAVLMYNSWVLLNYFCKIFRLQAIKVVSLKIMLITELVRVCRYDT